MIQKILILVSLIYGLAGCAVLPTHSLKITQGNVITEQNLKQLKIGMTEATVKKQLGNPLLVNVFSPNRLEYVYSVHQYPDCNKITRISCLFEHGRLKHIQ